MHGIKVRNVAILACIGLAVSFPTFAVESQQEQDAQPDLQQAVELIEDGDFAAAATILEALTTDPVDDELELSDARDMVLAYLYLGIARLYLADDNDARERSRTRSGWIPRINRKWPRCPDVCWTSGRKCVISVQWS